MKGEIVCILVCILFVFSNFANADNLGIYSSEEKIDIFHNSPKEWYKTFGGRLCDSGFCVQQTIGGGYIIAGIFLNSSDTKFSNR